MSGVLHLVIFRAAGWELVRYKGRQISPRSRRLVPILKDRKNKHSPDKAASESQLTKHYKNMLILSNSYITTKSSPYHQNIPTIAENMRILMTVFATLATLTTLAQGFVIADCHSGQITNFANNECQKWTGNIFSFQSDLGCHLYAYSGDDCKGNVTPVQAQNTCTKVDGWVGSVECVISCS